jgi:hypothetical protein
VVVEEEEEEELPAPLPRRASAAAAEGERGRICVGAQTQASRERWGKNQVLSEAETQECGIAFMFFY